MRSQPVEMEHTTALEMLRSDRDHAAGVIAIERERLMLIRTQAIVLASGGAGRIYPLTSNMPESTGDGYAVALRSGLALTGMEFVQFTPTALAYPEELAELLAESRGVSPADIGYYRIRSPIKSITVGELAALEL